MEHFVISWIDGASGQEVEARMRTEDGALELAAMMSVGADSTVEFDDGITVNTWKFQDGQQTDFEAGPKRHDLQDGVTASVDAAGNLSLHGLLSQIHLNPKQIKNLKELLK